MITLVVSNRDRFDLDTNSSKFFIKSLNNQSFKDFKVLLVDGGSTNYAKLLKQMDSIPFMDVIQHNIGEEFERAKLNNVGILNANTEYVLTTDVDMFFGPDFIFNVMKELNNEDCFVESRTLYWKKCTSEPLYKGEIDIKNLNKLRDHGRIKKRTSAGGCQCTSIDNWKKVRGFDEKFVGWGSEDYDLLNRVKKIGIPVRWIGEGRDIIQLFHQPHEKMNIKHDLKCQEKNKKILYSNRELHEVNPNGWGGKTNLEIYSFNNKSK